MIQLQFSKRCGFRASRGTTKLSCFAFLRRRFRGGSAGTGDGGGGVGGRACSLMKEDTTILVQGARNRRVMHGSENSPMIDNHNPTFCDVSKRRWATIQTKISTFNSLHPVVMHKKTSENKPFLHVKHDRLNPNPEISNTSKF